VWTDGEEQIAVLDAAEIVERAVALAKESYRHLPFAAAERGNGDTRAAGAEGSARA
jgi:hypothetical protein